MEIQKPGSNNCCSPGPILWPPTISFELHAEMAEEIDLEKCTFRNFGSSVILTLTLDRVEVTLVRIYGRGLPTHQIRWKSEKTFCGRTDVRTDTPEFQSTIFLSYKVYVYLQPLLCSAPRKLSNSLK